jgi:invasion protein IalB
MYDDDIAPAPETDQRPRRQRRSPLIPILAITAALLAIIVGAAIIMFALGIFDSGERRRAATSAPPAQQAQPANVSATASARPPQQSESEVPRAVVSVAPPAQDLPPIRAIHGDWQLRCDTPAGATNEQCFLMQFVTAEDRENVGLMVVVLKTADGEARIMRIVAPLGVLLPAGLQLKIDAEDLGKAGFVRCTPRGCVAEVILEDSLVQKLQSGTTATFIIFQTPEEGVGIPIALNGFGSGYASLP